MYATLQKLSCIFLPVMGESEKNILLKQIAKRVKQLRKEKGVTQRDVMYTTDINIIRIEKAEINITIHTIQRLCQYFEVTLEEFFKGI
jgi:transcriptional regulator with XRE-family HTH domain